MDKQLQKIMQELETMEHVEYHENLELPND